MLNFESSLFALAGVLAAAGPIVIHLVNRRRFRSVPWAAMDFLQQALDRSKRLLHLRDVVLLALRVLCVVLLGLTFARPFYSGSALGAVWYGGCLAVSVITLFGAAIWGVIAADTQLKKIAAGSVGTIAALLSLWCGSSLVASRAVEGTVSESRRQPLHAILLIDNTRSVGMTQLGETLLSQMKQKALAFLSTLPSDSRITVIPLAGSEDAFTLDAVRHREEAEKALERLAAVDMAGNIRRGVELAVQAAKQVTEVPAKRVVLFTDLQQSEFHDVDWGDLAQSLGGLQIMPITAASPANVWLTDFQIEDGLASVEAPCRFLARVKSAGGESTASVLWRLSIDGVEVASQTVELSPGQTRQVEFTSQLEGLADPERTHYALAELELQSDHPAQDQLPADNKLSLMVPVVAALPVVFVDEYGGQEDLSLNRIGESYALRHLIAPKTAGELDQRRLIRVVHLRQDQLSQEVLSTARLVVMAGVERPDACVTLLREFVQQGGPLLILAGGNFDPIAWQELARQDGQGILPAPLKSDIYGTAPEEATSQLKPFYADFSSMQHDFFLVDQESPDQLAALYESAPFFKAVRADLSDSVFTTLVESETKRLAAEQKFLADEVEQRGGVKSPEKSESQQSAGRRHRELEPQWWVWRSPLPMVDRNTPPRVLAERSQPQLLAKFKGLDLPFVVQRRIGAGRIVLVTTGVTSNWNLLRTSGAMYLFHRMISLLMEETLPARNFETGQRMTLPVTRQPDVNYSLMRPSGRQEQLPVESLTAEASGVQIRSAVMSGAYRILAEQETGDRRTKTAEWVFAVNGPESESDLTRISAAELRKKIAREDIRILDAGEAIDLQGGTRRGQGFWQWCLVAMLVGLIMEMGLLSWPTRRRQVPA